MWSQRPILLVAAISAVSGSCTASAPPTTVPLPRKVAVASVPSAAASPPVAAPPPPPPDVPRLEPLAAPEPLVELALPEARPAVVSLPLESTGPRPVLVATHGAGGRATTHCALWRGIVDNRAFVLCPRGSAIYPYDPPHQSGYFYNGHPALAVEITKALAALAAAYPGRVDLTDPVFAGYSQGANMGSLVLPTHDARFARAILWEGGVGEYQEWNIRVSERFYERGGRRVLLACGRSECRDAAQKTVHYMSRGGLTPRLIYEPGAGHTYAGALGERVKEAFAWLVEDDPRF